MPLYPVATPANPARTYTSDGTEGSRAPKPGTKRTQSPGTLAEYFLPPGYQSQTVPRSLDQYAAAGRYWTPQRIPTSRRFQRHVYLWAASLISGVPRHRVPRHSVPRIAQIPPITSTLDVGCGPAIKLTELIAPLCPDIEGIDQPSTVAGLNGPGRYTPANLEEPNLAPWRTFDLILCADVVEHLLNPDPMLALIRGFAHDSTLILFSTPDRDRLRGRACRCCDKPDHVREWARGEFLLFLQSRGFEILSSRLMPQDDSPVRQHLVREARFRARLARQSSLCCHAVLCRVSARGGER